MKHLKRFYTDDDVSDFFDGFDESQSPGILMACDAYPGEAHIIPRPGATPMLNLVFNDDGVELFTRQIPYDQGMSVDDTDNGEDLIPEEYLGYMWDVYHDDVKISNRSKSLSELGINPGDTLVYESIPLK
jgi:hypothetical protein